MKVRFLADADLNRAIVSGVLRREPSLDFLTAQAAGLRGMNDPEVLALAAEQRRVLVSHDVGTMPAHFRAFRTLENIAPAYSLSRRTSMSGRQSTNSCSSGWHRKHRSGKTGSNGCHCETPQDMHCFFLLKISVSKAPQANQRKSQMWRKSVAQDRTLSILGRLANHPVDL